MGYAQTIKLVKDDTLPELAFSLRDSNAAAAGATLDENNSETWAPIDLTSATVRLRIRAIGSTEIKATLLCTITNAAAGLVATDFPVGTLDTAGTFEGEIEITFPGGGIQTVYDFLKFKVRGDFD